ncbi:hypothetical protein INR49_017269 [Caranx melampygus]|nr:hypothetical protein INR49_017269 [Caranx melampygus]
MISGPWTLIEIMFFFWWEKVISVLSVARDAIFILFISVPNCLQLEYVCNVDRRQEILSRLVDAEVSENVI